MRPEKQGKIGIADPPALANVYGPQLARFDPASYRRFGNFQSGGKFLHGLISILWHVTQH